MPDQVGDVMILRGCAWMIAEADVLVLARLGEMRVVAAGLLAERLPRLDGDVAVGLGREIENDFRRVDIGVDARHALRSGRPR